MVSKIILIAFYALMPAVLIYLTQKSKALSKIGAVVLAYFTGLILGNTGILSHKSEVFRKLLSDKSYIPAENALEYYQQGLITSSDLMANNIAVIQDTVMIVAILLAIPLLLFSLDIRREMKHAKSALLSLGLAIASLLIVIISGYFIFKNLIDETWKVSGALVGIYTGGTPNLAAISRAVELSPETFILTHTYDLALGAFFLFFLLTVAQRLFNTFLPRFKEDRAIDSKSMAEFENAEMDDFTNMITKNGLFQLFKGLGLSILIVGIAAGISFLVHQTAQNVTVILVITTLGIAFSLIRSVNRIKKTFQLGMYFIIVFSLVISSMADLGGIFRIDYLYLFLFVALAVFGSMIVHLFLSWIFRVDTDTTIITMTALTYSPPFVPVVASALKNKNVLISGLTVGILGYVFGNYIGIALAYFLRGF